ncbi:transposase [Klebsiella pneumoniae]|nr:transposase [Klebsiella pneumoniae]
MFAGKKSAQIREILISESAWEEMTCLFAPSLHPFRIIKRQFGFVKARYKGLLKNDNQLAMLFTLANLFRVDQMIRQWERSQ